MYFSLRGQALTCYETYPESIWCIICIMLNVSVKYENEDVIDDIKDKIHSVFPDKNSDEIFKLINDFDEGFIAAREYFAYFFPMTTKTVIDYVNCCGMGRSWQFITDAIFDEGINALYRFYDGRASQNGDILRRSCKILGRPISKRNKDDVPIKMLVTYRNQKAAHFGNDYHLSSSNITYDLPIILLERLRRDRCKFEMKHFGSDSILSDDILSYFVSMMPVALKALNSNVDYKEIRNELSLYINSVISSSEGKFLRRAC